jgi:hypothetical protein
MQENFTKSNVLSQDLSRLEKIGQKHIDKMEGPSDSYFAGFMDGESCLRWNLSRPGLTGGTPRIAVSNTYRPILALFEQRFGGKVILKQKATEVYRTCWEWYCTGSNARNCLRAVLPYLIEKQEQARIVLQIGTVHPIWRQSFLKKLKDLKKVDYAI